MPPFAVFLAGLAVGAGAMLLAPALAPQAVRGARPLVKNGLKLAVAATEALRVAAAEAAETVEDLYAEATAEHAAEQDAAREAHEAGEPTPKPAAGKRRARRAKPADPADAADADE